MYSKIIIDTSNVYMRAYSVGASMTYSMEDGTTMVTGGIYNFLRMVKSLENRFLKEGGSVYFLFDNSHSGIVRRKEIDPSYKSNRTRKDENFYRSIDLLQMILLNYRDSWYCVKKSGYEADDLVYPLIKEFSNDDILLVSNDLDWFRGISEHVHVAKYEKDESGRVDYVIYDSKLFEKKMGFKPSVSSMVIYKSFRGDTSDNIPPGVPGIRTDSLISIISQCNSIKEVVEKADALENVSDTFRSKIKESSARLFLNEKLVSYQDISYRELKDDIYKGDFHPKMLHSLYKSLGFQIDRIDPRIRQYYIKDSAPITSKNFLQKVKIRRA